MNTIIQLTDRLALHTGPNSDKELFILDFNKPESVLLKEIESIISKHDPHLLYIVNQYTTWN